MKKTTIFMIFIACLIFTIGCTKNEEVVKDEFVEITECIFNIDIMYSSEINVSNETEVQTVFNEYMEWAKNNNNSALLGTDWELSLIKPRGIYENVKYWAVAYTYIEEGSQGRGGGSVEISENGDVVLIMGCV